MKTGAVAFLDVLGWKGAGTRAESLKLSFRELTNKIKTDCQEFNSVIKEEKLTEDGILGDIGFLSLSDTIVISVEGKSEHSVSILTTFCSELIPEWLEKGLPLRGTISFGEYDIDQEYNLMLGSAIDEAASWYETTDWIGVHLTPSAKMGLSQNFSDLAKYKIVKYDFIPFKVGNPKFGDSATWNRILNLCVDWTCNNKELLSQGTTLAPAIAIKYFNTLDFLDRGKKSEVDKTTHS